MTTKHQILCVTREEPGQRITAIGGVSGSAKWFLSQQQAIEAIERKQIEFYFRHDGAVIPVYVSPDVSGIKQLTAGNHTEVLLNLQECNR